jgi:serine kinase of HPr protein (carbohydrate metabolism regulator)
LDAKVDIEVDSLHVKRIAIEDLVGYVDIVRVDMIQVCGVKETNMIFFLNVGFLLISKLKHSQQTASLKDMFSIAF